MSQGLPGITSYLAQLHALRCVGMDLPTKQQGNVGKCCGTAEDVLPHDFMLNGDVSALYIEIGELCLSDNKNRRLAIPI